ncbi:DUF393 domain-containing protein [Hoyosella rhizosphaerae]|uniref:DUF393 domain-containing protein n=1 Tax=Hoyosella rhizosphaerae TaxID=1755582 RepID=A0A916UGW6_9ACTN|nr:DCC1-like thiol-disulfide oxidoreductase family protein [Hoyosella rhizosphaerae]MBN4928171.1 DUF393 domain-containing protein [Hoyosella rhizosphaerae]GGC72967.1 hypothetical protein GCM10011410_27550 [Hoyosella rhizosphaerae]
MAEPEIVVLYDRDCGFCVRCVNILGRLDRHRRVGAVAFQSPGALEAFAVSEADAAAAVWAKKSDGTLTRGAAAVNAALTVATGSSIPARVYALPGMTRVQDVVYQWVADHRHWMPGGTKTCTLD